MLSKNLIQSMQPQEVSLRIAPLDIGYSESAINRICSILSNYHQLRESGDSSKMTQEARKAAAGHEKGTFISCQSLRGPRIQVVDSLKEAQENDRMWKRLWFLEISTGHVSSN